MVFWIVVQCSLVVRNQRFEGRAASVFRVEFRDGGDVSDYAKLQSISNIAKWSYSVYQCQIKESECICSVIKQNIDYEYSGTWEPSF